MRLIQLLSGAPQGGAETFFVTLNAALQRRADTLGLVQRQIVRNHPHRVNALRSLGCDPRTARFGGNWDPFSQWQVDRLIQEFEPDIALAWMNRASQHLPQRRSYVAAARLGGYYKIKNYQTCDHLILITPDLQRHVVDQGWPKDRTTVIPNFTSLRRTQPVDRASLDTPEDAPLVVTLGRLHPVKGFDVLIRAVQSLPGVYLWIAGDGPYQEELERVIEETGTGDRVRLLGWRSDQAALFSSGDVFVMPSNHEPNGTVIIESWATRTPLVATDTHGPRWLIKDGVNGLITPVGDADALAQRLRRVLESPALRQDLVEAGWEEVQSRFTEEAIAPRYHEVLQSMLATPI